MFWHTLRTTMFSYSCVNNLYVLFCVFKFFKVIELPTYVRYNQWYMFCLEDISLQAFIGRYVKFIELLPCVMAKCVSQTMTSKQTGRNSFGWEILGESPYSLDLTLNDFHHFGDLKHHLRGNYYNDNEVLEAVMKSWLSD